MTAPAPPPLRIAVIGSRSFARPKLLAEVMAEYRDRITLLVSGGADGADRLGEKWARKNDVETLIFEPDFKRYKHAYHHRNRLIVEHADLVVAFWDGRSTGTAYTLDYAKRRGVPTRVVRF